MKKLLAAVTSFAMSASLMSGAFASSFNVSAAGRYSAVQPNVSIGEVTDVSVNKTAQADFVVTPEEVSVKPGETVRVQIFADPGSHKAGTLIVELKDSDLPQGITSTVTDGDLRCRAVSGVYTFEKLNGRYYCDTLSDGEPMTLNPERPIIAFTLSVPATAEPGDYEYNLSHFHVVEDGYNGVEFDATINPGKIHILGAGETTPATTTQETPGTTKSNDTTNVAATTKTPDPSLNIDSGFVVTPKDVTVAAGEDATIDIMCENTSGRKAAQFIVRVDDANLPIKGATSTMASTRCSAVSGTHVYEELNGTWYCDTLEEGEPQSIDTSKPVARFKISVPAGTTPGTYTWYLDRFHVVENGYEAIEFDATIKPGNITVTGGGETEPATTTSTTTTDKGDKPVEIDAGFIVTPADVEAEPGQDVTIDIMCENTSNRKAAQFIARVDDENLPIKGATATMKSTRCPAVSGVHAYEEIEGTWYCDTLDEGDPQEIDTSKPVARYTISIPEDAKPGDYEWKLDRFHVVENGHDAVEFDATLKSGLIKIKGDVTTTSSTTTTTTSTTTSGEVTAVSTPTTTLPAVNGSVSWKIPTVKAAPGASVKVAVAVDGANDLAVAGAQFKINPASGVSYVSVADTSDAYGAKAVGNGDTNEYAFGEGKGAGKVGADGATVIEVTFKAPTTPGTYALKWADAFVSDTNGNDITDKVTLTDGAIIVDEAISGNVTWKIPTVHTVAGKDVTLAVAVEDPENSALPVAGAQFVIKPSLTVGNTAVSEQSTGYKSAIVFNKETNEYAFGEGVGKGIAATDGSAVVSVTYSIPAGTAPGTYPVTWGKDAFISDTNGNDITSSVTLVDGAIIIDDDTVDGDVTWTIPEKHAKPGDTVEMDVLVKVGEKNLAVGGAQFNIKQAAPIELSSASGSDGYKAALVYNKGTFEFAFGEGKGAGIEAEDGSAVLKLTYTVPENAEPGTYPVAWSDAFISDTNGNEITGSVTLVDGAIIIDEETTTTSSTTTEENTDTTTTTSSDVPVDTTTSTSTTNDGEETTTTTTITAPAGAILWQIQRVEATPGETVSVPVLVRDPNGVKLPIGGAQFGVTAATPIVYDSVSGSSAAYKSDIVANPSTFEFAFADAKGGEQIGTDGSEVFVLSYKVPEGTEAGEYPVEWTKAFFNVSSADGVDMTSSIICLDGAIIVKDPDETTTSTSTTTTDQPGEDTTTTTTTTTEVPEETTTTTTLTVAEGAIVWQVETVKAQPGDEVELDVIVLDPNGTALEVGGAQFIINNEGDIALVGGTGSDGYSAAIESGVDGDANRFAFAHPKGTGVAAANGAKVIRLTFKVPENIADGTYPVSLAELFASDTNGLDITKHILALPGAIVVEKEVTTTTSTTGTTTTSTTTTTTQTTASTTEEGETTTTTTVTAPAGAIIWQIQRVKAEPGEIVKVPVLVIDPNGVNLPVGGAQFGIKAVTPIVYDSVSAKADGYNSDLVANPSTFEFAFADAKGGSNAAADGATVLTLTYQVPEGTADGEYPVEWTKGFFNVSSEDGADMTNQIICLNGAIIVETPVTTSTTTQTTGPDTTTDTTTETTETTDTTATTSTSTSQTTGEDSTSTTTESTTTEDPNKTTTTSSTSTTQTTASTTGEGETTTTTTTTTIPAEGKLVATATVVDGFYFNHDSRSFNAGHVSDLSIKLVKADGTSEDVAVDTSLITFKEQVSGKDNPMEAYREEQTNFTYIVDVLYDGKPLEGADGKPMTFKAYIGVKGDSNLDNKADAKDASNALAFYSKASVMQEGDSSDNIRLNPDANEIINNNPDLDLDQFGAFLVDVDQDVYDLDNWKTKKSGRVIDAKDASAILAFYSKMSTSATDAQETWNEVLANYGRKEKIQDFLMK
ncbi:MAG: cellulose-binding protein CttA-related protein [Ruminococcus sp.]|nr:cellulose-binding protein CttA-related protein [Ruminococcus sp.]